MRVPPVRGVLVFLALPAFLSLEAFAAQPTASKTAGVTDVLTVDGNQVPLKHASAYAYKSLDPSKMNVSVLFSDLPRPAPRLHGRDVRGFPRRPTISGSEGIGSPRDRAEAAWSGKARRLSA